MNKRLFILPDPHLGHTKLVEEKLRPAGFTEKILNNLHKNLRPGDILICLGDVCFGNDVEWNEKLTAVRSLLHNKKWLVRGNHDKKSIDWQETDNGVTFDWGLANSNGAWFTLFREQKHTDEDLKKAKEYLYRNRDVVSISVIKVGG